MHTATIRRVAGASLRPARPGETNHQEGIATPARCRRGGALAGSYDRIPPVEVCDTFTGGHRAQEILGLDAGYAVEDPL
jgi:hypothetical protein